MYQTGAVTETSHSQEQEKFLSAVVAATPVAMLREGSSCYLTDSSLSINSLVLVAAQPLSNIEVPPHYHPSYSTLTPEVSRKSNNALSKAMNTLR